MKRFFISVMVSMGCFMAHAQSSITIPTVNIIPGTEKSVDVTIADANKYTAFQFDVALPTGVSLKKASVKNAGQSREINYGKVGDKYRVLSYAKDNAKLGETEVLSLTFEAETSFAADGQGTVAKDDIVLVDPEGKQPETVTGGTVDIKVAESESVTITAAGQAILCSSKNLDFSDVAGVKAYIASGHDKKTGVIWLTRVFDVPAGEAVLLMGDAGTYPVPVVEEKKAIYKNMLVGCKEATTITKNGGDNVTNYILSKPDGKEVGFYFAREAGSSIKAGGGYLPLPTTIEASGEAGSTVKIAMNQYGMKSYCPSQSLDFSEVEGLKAYIASGYTNKGIIRLTRVKQVPKGLGVLLMAPAEAKEYDVKTASLQQCYANMFEGTLEGKTIMKFEDDIVNYYLSVVNNVVGYYLASTQGTKISANGSWIPVPKSMTSFANATRGESNIPESLSLFQTDEMISLNLIQSFGGEDDGTTGIKRVDSEVDDDVWYNLKGQRIDTPTRKGLYIKNGKKVVVK